MFKRKQFIYYKIDKCLFHWFQPNDIVKSTGRSQLNLALSLIRCVTLNKSVNLINIIFLLCKAEIVMLHQAMVRIKMTVLCMAHGMQSVNGQALLLLLGLAVDLERRLMAPTVLYSQQFYQINWLSCECWYFSSHFSNLGHFF